MLKALIRKQFLELFQSYFKNSKTGKVRSKGGMIGMSIGMGFLFLFLAVMFAAMGFSLCISLQGQGKNWLYFALFGLIAIAFGTFGSVFNTYAGLYLAKDNEMLLSMPIPPSYLLISRMVSVYGMSLLYSGLCWIPGIVIYFIFGDVNALCVIFCILLTLILPLFITALTCVLGWVIAVLSRKLKRQKIFTVLISLVFIGIYYVVCFRFSSLIESLMMNSDIVGDAVTKWIWPAYELGKACTGDVLSMIVISLLDIALFVICCAVMSHSFIKIVTTSHTEKKVEYHEQKTKILSLDSALLKRELARFTSSTTYMLNCGLGLFFELIIAVLLIIKCGEIREMIVMAEEWLPNFRSLTAVLAAMIGCALSSMNMISQPSIALEGKTIWILQTMPLDGREVLKAKERLHFIFNIIPAVIMLCCAGFALELKNYQAILSILLVGAYILFVDDAGLVMGIKRPNLHWTNETAPIKQDFGVFIIMFGGWVICALLGFASFLLYSFIGADVLLVIYFLVFAALVAVMHHWLMTKGSRKFMTLN